METRLVIVNGFDEKHSCHSLQITEDMSAKTINRWIRERKIKGKLFYKVFFKGVLQKIKNHTVEGHTEINKINDKFLSQLRLG